jgi:hypothetical protein
MPTWKLVLSALALVAILQAQTSTGQIDVTVQDTSGAVVQGASITITGADTGNLARTLSTNDSGIAEAPLLQPGTYDVTVSVTGFERLLRRGIIVHVGDILNLRLTVTPGSATESITIVGETPLLEEKNVTLTQVMDEKQIVQLPLNGRNYLELGRLAAGAVPSQGSRDQTFSAYGNGGLQNAFLMDGARNESYLRGLDNRARDMLRPPLDALAEFQVQTSNFSAEFGASAGAVVSAITKNGTNRIHGSAYNFLRNDNMDAADFFAQAGKKPLLVQNVFGASAGGPIIKDRAWIFGAYEGTRQRNEAASLATVPTGTMQQGNFGATAIFDPLSTTPNANGTGSIRTEFPNNTIPASRFDKIGAQLLGFYPLPNQAGTANNYAANVPQFTNTNNLVIRGDLQISSKDSMFVRGSLTRSSINAFTTLPPPAQAPVDRTIPSEGIGYGYTRTFSNTLVNEFRFSWARVTIQNDETVPLNPIISGLLDPKIQHGTPNINVTGIAAIGAQPGCCGNSPLNKSSGVWDISDNVSKSFGKHLVKFGTDLQAIKPQTFSALNGRGAIGFTGVFSQDPQNRSKTGNPVADLILGDANSLVTGTNAAAIERGKYGGWYVQDQWAVTPTLTLNLGLRYELFFPFTETGNHMGNFVLDPGSPNYGKLVLAGLNGASRGLITLDENNFAPRVGFAWRVPFLKNTVIRSSYGVFYAQDQGNGVTIRMTNNPPFYGYGGVNISSDQLNPSTGFVLSSGQLAPRPLPIDPKQFVLSPSATSSLNSWAGRSTTPYVQEWNFTVQKQLPGNMVWETSYVGNIGTHLWGSYPANQPLTNTVGAVVARRPLAQYTLAPVTAYTPWNRSVYDGLSTHLEKRFSKGLSFVTSFTYGRAIDIQNSSLDACDGCEAGDPVQNAYNRNANRGPSDNNVPLRFVFGGIWDLPFGPGHAVVKQGWASQLVGFWQLSTIYQVQSGLPFTAVLSFDNANAGNTSWPNRVCSGTPANRSLTQWFDASCFVAPAQYQFGNEGRNALTGPGRNNIDMVLHRSFRLPFREGMALEFRAEAYNLFNHPQFAFPGATIGTSTAGVIGGTAVANRQLQMALRLAF